MPKCTKTPRPPGVTTTKACGCLNDRRARRDLVALGGKQREALALELDGVDAQVHQNATTVLGYDDKGVRVQLHDPPADRGDRPVT